MAKKGTPHQLRLLHRLPHLRGGLQAGARLSRPDSGASWSRTCTRQTIDRVQVDFLPFPTDLCDLCARRTAAGEKPACVKHCMSGCMSYGEVGELAKLMETMPRSVLYVPR